MLSIQWLLFWRCSQKINCCSAALSFLRTTTRPNINSWTRHHKSRCWKFAPSHFCCSPGKISQIFSISIFHRSKLVLPIGCSTFQQHHILQLSIWKFKKEPWGNLSGGSNGRNTWLHYFVAKEIWDSGKNILENSKFNLIENYFRWARED